MWHDCQLDTHHARGSHPSHTNWCVLCRVLAEKSALSARTTGYYNSPVPVYSLYAVGNGLKKVGGGEKAKNRFLIILRSIMSVVNCDGNVLFKLFFFHFWISITASAHETERNVADCMSFEFMDITLLYARYHGNSFLWSICFPILRDEKTHAENETLSLSEKATSSVTLNHFLCRSLPLLCSHYLFNISSMY